VPFFAIALVISAVTVYVQRSSGAMPGSDLLSFPVRAANAVVSYMRYLIMTAWPVDLIPYYVHPKDSLPAWQVIVSIAAILGITAAAWRLRRRYPYLLVGWLWYVGTLVPVIGFVQVGGQAIADRYTYVPLVGVFIAVAWGLAGLVVAIPRALIAVAVACFVALAGSSLLAHEQTAHWRSSIALFEHTVAIDSHNPVAQGNLGAAYLATGRYDDAVTTIERGLRLDPSNPGNLRNLAMAKRKLGQLDEAERLLRTALELDPRAPRTFNHLALVYLDRGRLDDAENAISSALDLDPGFLDAHLNRGNVFLRRGELARAAEQYNYVLGRRPRDADALSNLGTVRLLETDYAAAIELFHRALAIAPRDAVTRTNLAIALDAAGRPKDALNEAEWAVRDDPNYDKAKSLLDELIRKAQTQNSQ
jgi:tetratricopeptide (TPR) repeat protein